MVSVIPFTGRVETQEQDEWIKAINSQSNHCKLLPISELSETQRQSAKIAVVANPEAETLKSLPSLVWLQSLWAGVETIFESGIDKNIQIVRLTDPQLAKSMAEAALAWSLYLHRKMPQYRIQQNNAQWLPLALDTPENCNISVFGLGKLGVKAATRLQQNGFTVRGWSRSRKVISQVETFNGETGLENILPVTDIAIILLPLTPQTEKLFNESLLHKLPKGASIINFARGRIMVDDDLLRALKTGHIEHAVLDVFSEEPLQANHVFWSHESITVLPHISAPTTLATAAVIAAENIDRYFETGSIPEAADRSKGY